jgi:hypothetical protein
LEEGKEGEERFCLLFHLLFLDEFLREGLRELWLPVFRQAEFPQHWLSFLLFSLCLSVSSLVFQAGGKPYRKSAIQIRDVDTLSRAGSGHNSV